MWRAFRVCAIAAEPRSGDASFRDTLNSLTVPTLPVVISGWGGFVVMSGRRGGGEDMEFGVVDRGGYRHFWQSPSFAVMVMDGRWSMSPFLCLSFFL